MDDFGDDILEAIEEVEFEVSALKVGNFILAKFLTKLQVINYIRQIEDISISTVKEVQVKFLRKMGNSCTFILADIKDISEIETSNLVAILESPVTVQK